MVSLLKFTTYCLCRRVLVLQDIELTLEELAKKVIFFEFGTGYHSVFRLLYILIELFLFLFYFSSGTL